MDLLNVENLTKRYGGLVAVSDTSLKVEEGRIVTLIGPNGAGKTTLFAMISGFVKPDTGRVTFSGQDVTDWPPHRVCRLGLTRTFQIVQPFAGLTVLENIAVGAHVHHKSRSDALDVARQVRDLEQLAQVVAIDCAALLGADVRVVAHYVLASGAMRVVVRCPEPAE